MNKNGVSAIDCINNFVHYTFFFIYILIQIISNFTPHLLSFSLTPSNLIVKL